MIECSFLKGKAKGKVRKGHEYTMRFFAGLPVMSGRWGIEEIAVSRVVTGNCNVTILWLGFTFQEVFCDIVAS